MTLPALRQSTYESMACPHGYGLVHIQGQRTPDSLNSDRGLDCHAVLAQYAEHCARKRTQVDYAHFDKLITGRGEEATEILDVARESLTIDWQNFFAAEAALWLDEEFMPTLAPADLPRHLQSSPNSLLITEGIEPSGKPAAYGGILDLIYLFPGGVAALIDDYKSHPQPFKPTTFQGKFYPLLLMRHLPALERVEMRYRFIRYSNKVESQVYTREDIPMLAEAARRVRARQGEYQRLFEDGGIDNLKAMSGTHCQYCPAILESPTTCPIGAMNPQTNMSPDERLRWRLWFAAWNRVNNKAMSQYVQGSEEKITAMDANGNAYVFGPQQKERITYPVFALNEEHHLSTPIIDALEDWALSEGEDVMPSKGKPSWLTKLRISSTQLKSKLKTKKRSHLDQRIEDLAETETRIEMRVSRDAQVDDGAGEEYTDPTDPTAFENTGANDAQAYEF
jgi:hypothetical protein